MNFSFWKDGYKRRAVIYMAFGVAGLLYEILFRNPPRTLVMVLWGGIVAIGIIIWSTLKDPNAEK